MCLPCIQIGAGAEAVAGAESGQEPGQERLQQRRVQLMDAVRGGSSSDSWP